MFTVMIGREYVCVAPFNVANEIAKDLVSEGEKGVKVRRATVGEINSNLPHCKGIAVLLTPVN